MPRRERAGIHRGAAPTASTVALLSALATGCAAPVLSWRADLCGDPTLAAPRPASPTSTRPGSRPPGPARTDNVIVVTLDGVRWQEIFEGVDPALAGEDGVPQERIVSAERLMPNLHRRLIKGGVALGAPERGEPVLASGPEFVSLPGYLELLSGRPSGCRSNSCPATRLPTLLDEVRVGLGLRPEQVAAIASWEKIERAASADGQAVTISAGRHGGLSRDRLRGSRCSRALLDVAAEASSGAGLFDYRPDAYTARLALDYLGAERPRFLFVGLGDTDELAHRSDYGGYLEALRFADRFLGELFALLDEMGDHGAATTVLVTADHGRAHGFAGHGGGAPESARVFLLAAGGAVPARGRVAAAAPRYLADVAPTVRALLGLAPDPAPDAGQPLPELVGGPALATSGRLRAALAAP